MIKDYNNANVRIYGRTKANRMMFFLQDRFHPLVKKDKIS